MKRVLVIAYYFPPLGMGGVQRVLKFVKYLPDFGWEPTVLTVKDVVYYAKDASLLKEAGKCEVVRTGSLDPLRIRRRLSNVKKEYEGKPFGDSLTGLGRWNRVISTWICVPDTKVLWLPFAVQRGLALLKSGCFDLIFTTSPPHSAHLAGLVLKRRTGLPWTADFRDDWMGDYVDLLPTSVQRRVNRALARRVVNGADRVVAVSQPIKDRMICHSKKKDDNFTVIPNGYDRADFGGFRSARTDRLTITYCGTVSRILDPGPFLESVAEAIRMNPKLNEKLRVRFVGADCGMNLRKTAGRLGLDEVVECVGYVSHEESIGWLMNSDMLLLLIPNTFGAGMVTGKVFEYLASGKPILAVVPPGEAERLVIKHARGIVVRPENLKAMAAQLLRSVALWERGDLKLSVPRWQGISQYDRRTQTERLAELFDSVV